MSSDEQYNEWCHDNEDIEAIQAEALEALVTYHEWLEQNSPEDIEAYLERLYEHYEPIGPAPF